jgi:hypothetical protein
MSLASLLRSQREEWFTTGGHRFLLRRPRRLELALWAAESNAAVAIRSLAGWEDVSQDNVLGNGDASPAPFSAELAEEWLYDRADLLVPIIERLQEMIKASMLREEDAKKN